MDHVSDYDPFAEAFDVHAQTSAYNAFYDRPAVLDLLGPVDGLSVLDAGCGSGLYAEALLERGARVTGFDASPKLVELARTRVGDRPDLRVHDLNDPIDWIPDGSFDRAVMALVLHHLEQPVPALRELHRVLADDGRLIVSTLHPTADWLRLGGSYFRDEMVEETWQRDWLVHFRRAPLQALVADFASAGFVIESLVEPRPVAELANADPERFAKLNAEPAFIAFRLAKRV
jgi:SAM-dependent methyltransferase